MRRQFQIGPSSYCLEKGDAGWYVVEEWSQADRHGERDDGFKERVSGPHERAQAEQALARFRARSQ